MTQGVESHFVPTLALTIGVDVRLKFCVLGGFFDDLRDVVQVDMDGFSGREQVLRLLGLALGLTVAVINPPPQGRYQALFVIDGSLFPRFGVFRSNRHLLIFDWSDVVKSVKEKDMRITDLNDDHIAPLQDHGISEVVTFR